VAPTGYAFTGKDLGGNDATDSDVDPTTGKTITTTLESGENDLSWDAGLTKPTAAYGDKVWLDKNANGVQDAGEAGLAGVTVKLLNSAGTVVSTTTTDANGNYLFDNLTPGDYSAQVVAPTGYFVSPKDQGGNDATDSDFDPTTGKTISTTLTDGEKDLSWDAGLYQKASIGDKVWADCNNNGIQDGTEAGVPGVTVKLLDASGNVVATTLTDGNGNYVFKDLMPGTYSVQFVAPTGYLFTTKDVGTNDAIDSDVGNSVVPGTTNLITNGSFESGTTGWTGNCDSVEVNTAGAFGVSAVTGAMVAELDANTAGAGTGFYQDVATVTGQAYQLTVDLAQRSGTAAATNTVEIWWDGAKIATIDPTSTALTKYTFDVVAKDASSRVEFREQTGDDDSLGGIIDNVRLVTSGTAGGAVGTTIQTTLESGENDLTWDAGLTVKQVTATFDFSGNSATDGTDGNVLCFSNNGISVNASAFSRDKTATTWAKAFLGSYAGGLGVTDGSEGSGSGNTHTVDNNGTRDNYVLFEFSQSVVVDKAYLGYVVGDSDAKVWIGTVNGAFDSHITLSDAVLSSMGFVEVNATTLTSARWADLNAAGYVGNVLIVSADVTGTECDDYFKIQNLVVSTPNAFCATDVSIGDRVWNDANANGVQDAGEAGIAGVTVKLLNSAGAVITTTTTDANGNYLFDKLAAGDYKVQVVTPTGYVVTTKDASVATDATDSDIDASGISGVYTLTQGSNNLTVDAGLYCPPSTASIGDKVWLDSNKNGIQDSGEAGYCGATVKLLNAAGTVVATTTTDVNGNYKFSNVAPGDYSVQVVAPSGYVFSAKDQGTNDAVDSDVDTSTGKTITTTLVAGENDLTWDAGIYCPPTTASIGDKVWEDMNYNGVQDAGEAGIKGVTVKLLNSYGTVVATTTTDASGNYLFSNVNVGNYKVQVVAPTGYYYTKQNQGTNDAIDSDVDSSGKTALTSLTAGESDLSWDTGLYRKACIGDKVWEDSNHNNLQDYSEAGICNVKVSLQNSAGTTIASTYTDAYGNYKFTNLDPGSYRVVFDKSATVYKYTDMSNWDWAAKDIGTDDTRDADAYSYGDVATTAYTTLVSGEADLTWDAAITPIVLDLDHNGIQTIAREDSTGKFDLFGNGQAIESGWISSGDAFLAIDIDKNGKIDNLSELFGGTSKGDGFAKLGAFDSNGDGFVDAKDAHFGDLRVWQDLNGNHQTDAGELRTLAEAGVASLKVDHVDLPAVDAQGNLHLERSSAVMADGSSIDMADVYFNVSAADAEAAGVELPNLSALLGDDRSLDLVLGSSAVTASATTEAASASATVCDGAVTALSQLANLYDEQQFALIAA
jgi:protocatechuate 3,4-dioxygenase beta subunit